MSFKRILDVIIRLPSTILHELLHTTPILFFIIAGTIFNVIKSLFGIQKRELIRIINFSILPNKNDNSLGSVTYIGATNIQHIIINLFPIISWIALVYLINYFGYISYKNGTIAFFIGDNSLLTNMINMILFIYLSWAGKLSNADLKNVLNAILSVEFSIYIVIILIFYYEKEKIFRIYDDFILPFYSNIDIVNSINF